MHKGAVVHTIRQDKLRSASRADLGALTVEFRRGREARRGTLMSSSWTFLFSDDNRALREKVVGVYGLLFAANVAVWIWAICLSRQFPMMLGIAALAYSLGLRHALDADHIAAIDNVTRKFMQKGKRPIGVGLYFSLGHSTIVVGLTIAIA